MNLGAKLAMQLRRFVLARLQEGLLLVGHLPIKLGSTPSESDGSNTQRRQFNLMYVTAEVVFLCMRCYGGLFASSARLGAAACKEIVRSLESIRKAHAVRIPIHFHEVLGIGSCKFSNAGIVP